MGVSPSGLKIYVDQGVEFPTSQIFTAELWIFFAKS